MSPRAEVPAAGVLPSLWPQAPQPCVSSQGHSVAVEWPEVRSWGSHYFVRRMVHTFSITLITYFPAAAESGHTHTHTQE